MKSNGNANLFRSVYARVKMSYDTLKCGIASVEVFYSK